MATVDQYVSARTLPGLYAAAHAFVLPSRGEGWGRPHVEAMAMGLPVIATNWSGPTAYMNEGNGYPVRYRLEPVTSGPFRRHHRWAEPDVAHLQEVMTDAVNRPDEARRRGAQARLDVLRKYSPEVVGALVESRLRHIEHVLRESGDID